MSYTVAYTSTFYSVANVKWRVDILTTGTSVTETIDLDYDRPISIEWVDTNKADAIQPALLTVRAINSKDRQFAKLLGDWLAKAEVYRNDRLFWTGMIDNAIFEEPYSYAANYVTEISFSDFGPLKRLDFMLEGVQSIHDIIVHCIDKVGLADILTSPMISLQVKGVQASLGNMFVNTDVFRGDDEGYPKCYDVLEQTLQPFGIRIVQNENRVLLYDIERLENIGTPVRIVWKGTDAIMGGSECYSQFSVELSPEAKEDIIDGNLEDVDGYWTDDDMFCVQHLYEYDGYTALAPDGFTISFGYSLGNQRSIVLNREEGRFFRSQSLTDDADDVGIARRAYCMRRFTTNFVDMIETSTPFLLTTMDWLFKCDSMYVPLIADSGKFQLRVTLDLLFSINRNPIQGKMYKVGHDVDPTNWNSVHYIRVPVKLELIDRSGNVLYHYRNMRILGVTESIEILPKSERGWVAGAAETWQDFSLQYYKDGLDENPLNGGWVTNRQSLVPNQHFLFGIESARKDGEYLPMPPAAGYLRLTVSNGFKAGEINEMNLGSYNNVICWQMYRNPKVTVVRNNKVDDGIKNEKVVESDWLGDILGKFSTSPKIGTYHKGMAPSSLSLIFDQYGMAYESFTKGGLTNSLEYIRLIDFYGQYISTHISLDGTAELTTSLGPITDASTTGNFLPMMRNLDPRSDTMQIRMEQIYIDPDPHYYFAWSDPVCVLEYEAYEYAWSDPICAQKAGASGNVKDE